MAGSDGDGNGTAADGADEAPSSAEAATAETPAESAAESASQPTITVTADVRASDTAVDASAQQKRLEDLASVLYGLPFELTDDPDRVLIRQGMFPKISNGKTQVRGC